MQKDRVKTLTVDELISVLMKYPQDTKIYMSRDEEGNGYGTLAADGIGSSRLDKAIILYPISEGLEYDDIFPKQWEKDSEEDL